MHASVHVATMAASRSFSVQAMVRGYHIYKTIWEATINGELLACKENIHDTCEERWNYHWALSTKDFCTVFDVEDQFTAK